MNPLQVNLVNFYPKENAKNHKTDKYEVLNDEDPKTTIVRRGQPFRGMVHFNRPYDEAKDLVQLVFSLGQRVHMETQGSVYIRPDVVPDKHTWTAKLTASEENTLSFEVSTPVTLPVGNWALQVVTRLKNSSQRAVYKYDYDLYILFNPWNQDDQTYMEDSNLLQEYVLEDIGKVWLGRVGKPWTFGQFDDVVLSACMFMLDRANMPFQHRGDPIKLSRVISQIVNVNDDDGVVIGRWNGEYDAGTAPWEWTDSVDILSQFLKTNTTDTVVEFSKRPQSIGAYGSTSYDHQRYLPSWCRVMKQLLTYIVGINGGIAIRSH